jgi:hypothetical protein
MHDLQTRISFKGVAINLFLNETRENTDVLHSVGVRETIQEDIGSYSLLGYEIR